MGPLHRGRRGPLCKFSYDQGITFFDNGDAYGNGRAETVFGKFLKESGISRDKVEIGSKFGYDFYSDPGEPGAHRERKQDFSAKFMRSALEKSLKRLGTDYVDLYMAHNIKLPQFRDDLFAELEKVKDEGQDQGLGREPGAGHRLARGGRQGHQDHGAKAVQTVYNMFEQNPGREFCEMARSHHAGVIARVHDNSSILKDVVKVDTTIGESDHRKFRDQSWKVYGLKKLELVRHYATDHGMTVHQLACKWLLAANGLAAHHRHVPQRARDPRGVRVGGQAEPVAGGDQTDRRGLRQRLGPRRRRPPLRHQEQHRPPAGRVRSGYVAPPVLIA